MKKAPAPVIKLSLIASAVFLLSLAIISQSSANWRLGAEVQVKRLSSRVFIEKVQTSE